MNRILQLSQTSRSKPASDSGTGHLPKWQAAALTSLLPLGGRKRRRPRLSPAAAVSQLLDIHDDIIAVSDELKALVCARPDDSSGERRSSLLRGILCQCEEVLAISRDLEEVCAEIVPGSPAARSYSFVSMHKNFAPAPAAGGGGNNQNR
jgi:hypothetical protein